MIQSSIGRTQAASFYAVFWCRKKALSKSGSSERMRRDQHFCSFFTKQKIPAGKRKMQPWLFWYFFGQAKKYKNRCVATELVVGSSIESKLHRRGKCLMLIKIQLSFRQSCHFNHSFFAPGPLGHFPSVALEFRIF